MQSAGITVSGRQQSDKSETRNNRKYRKYRKYRENRKIRKKETLVLKTLLFYIALITPFIVTLTSRIVRYSSTTYRVPYPRISDQLRRVKTYCPFSGQISPLLINAMPNSAGSSIVDPLPHCPMTGDFIPCQSISPPIQSLGTDDG